MSLKKNNFSPNPHIKEMEHKIIHGDCLEIMKGMADKSVDLVLTDPPYNLRNVGNSKQKGNLSKSDFGEWDENFTPIFLKEARRVLKPEGSILVFSSDRTLLDYYPILRNEWNYKATLVWHKTNPAPSFRKVNYISSCEFILWAVNERLEKCDFTFNFSKQTEMHNFIETSICGGNERTTHPTQKPLKLIEKLIKVHSNENDLILDPFAGSCTTLIACKQLNRRCICIEKEEDYVKICHERLGATSNSLFANQ